MCVCVQGQIAAFYVTEYVTCNCSYIAPLHDYMRNVYVRQEEVLNMRNLFPASERVHFLHRNTHGGSGATQCFLSLKLENSNRAFSSTS